MNVSDSTFTGNTAGGGGGAIANGSDSGDGNLTVSNSTFSDNSATDGGAIDNADASGSGTTAVSDSTFSGNTASSDGGAVDNADNSAHGSTTVTSSTFSGNGAGGSGGTVDNPGNGDSGPASFGASILVGATSGGECGGAVTDLGYNIDDGSTCNFSGPSLSNTAADLDPSGLQNNGGPTQTIALEPGSPAIGLVTNAPQCPATDQRGAARPTSGTCDAGAYDTNGTPFDPSVSSVTITGGLITPTVTISGSGFGNQADLGAPAPATACSNTNTGSDYDNFSFSDVTAGWLAGGGSNCIGVSVSSYSSTQIVVTFGNGYGNGASPDEYGALGYGDSLQVNVLGATFSGSVPAYSPAPTISSVAITGSLATPTVTVTGSGFGTEDDLGSPVPAYCGNTGFDYDNNFYLLDGWGAGEGSGPFGDCTGVSITSYSDTQVSFTFGNGYGTGNNQYGVLSPGDSFQMNVLGTTFNGTVPYPASPTIGGVTFGGDPSNPTVTMSGSGFGTSGDLGTPGTPGCGGSGSDYGNIFYFSDTTGSWQAGQGTDCTGLVISSYSSTQIMFTFGDQYSVFGPIANGDSFSMTLFGVTFNGTASLGTGYTCTVSGMSGTTSFPVVESESPAPPASIDAGGTFQTAPAARVTIPATVVDHFRNLGATSLTIASQSTGLDGRTSVGGPLSGAVNPNVETASASNLPQSDSTLTAGVPYTYSTAYNPVTFQTGPGHGTVFITPGQINAEVTFVIHGTATPEDINCSPPSGVAALGSTTVDPPPPTPTFQVPASTPPLQNQVSSGTDGGWGATVANTSTASVTGLTASVRVTDGGPPVTFDLTGMAASGTNCSNAGSGKLSCVDRDPGRGGLGHPRRAGQHHRPGRLGGHHRLGHRLLDQCRVPRHHPVDHQGGGRPGRQRDQGGGHPRDGPAQQQEVTQAGQGQGLVDPAQSQDHQDGGESRGLRTLGRHAPPSAPRRWRSPSSRSPPRRSPPCARPPGPPSARATSSRPSATSRPTPPSSTPSWPWSSSSTASTCRQGSVYFLKPNGKTVDKLSTCKKTSTGFTTPCVFGKEQVLGSAAHDTVYAQDTVYFTGNDPAMGRR